MTLFPSEQGEDSLIEVKLLSAQAAESASAKLTWEGAETALRCHLWLKGALDDCPLRALHQLSDRGARRLAILLNIRGEEWCYGGEVFAEAPSVFSRSIQPKRDRPSKDEGDEEPSE